MYYGNGLTNKTWVSFLGAFTKLREATVSFVMCVRMEQLGSHRTDFSDISCLRIFRKYAERKKKFNFH